jgi:hypothetical protein
LRPFFGAKRATEIGTQILKDNLKLRQRNDNASATINKEITWLRRGSQASIDLDAPPPSADMGEYSGGRQKTGGKTKDLICRTE